MKKTIQQIGILALIFCFAIIPHVFAASTNNPSNKGESETIESAVFRSGQNTVINENVEGTVFATGSNVEINGNVDGDLFVAGRSITIRGNVTGNVYAGASDITILGKVDKDVFVGGGNTNLSENSRIGRDLFVGSGTVQLLDTVGRDAFVGSDSLQVGNRTRINRDLNIQSKTKPDQTIEQKVNGTIHWEDNAEDKLLTTRQILMNAIKNFLITTIAGLLLWAFVKFFKPFFWKNHSNVVLNEPLKAAGFGALAVILIPIIGFILLITVIGMKVSLFAGGILFLAIYVSKLIVAEVIGKLIMKTDQEKYFGILPVLVGLVILNLLKVIPFVGIIVRIITILLGVGSIFLKMINDRKNKKEIMKPVLETHE